MRNRWMIVCVFSVLTAFVVSGCATAKPRHTGKQAAGPAADQPPAALQSELQAKDQQIQDLQYQLEQSRHNPETNYTSANSSGSSKGGKSSLIHVSGVSVTDVQRALEKAGFDPGRVDGKIGKKTKAAIKAFQRAHNLKADGVIGEKTWKTLQS